MIAKEGKGPKGLNKTTAKKRNLFLGFGFKPKPNISTAFSMQEMYIVYFWPS